MYARVLITPLGLSFHFLGQIFRNITHFVSKYSISISYMKKI